MMKNITKFRRFTNTFEGWRNFRTDHGFELSLRHYTKHKTERRNDSFSLSVVVGISESTLVMCH